MPLELLPNQKVKMTSKQSTSAVMAYHNPVFVAVNNIAKFIFYLPYYICLYFYTVILQIKKSVMKKKKSLDGETVLVTGAASGIGQSVVWKLGKRFPKAVYVLWDVNENGLNDTKNKLEEIGAYNVHTYVVDLSDREDVVKTANMVREQIGPVTILFNNAGYSPYTLFLEADAHQEEKVIKINLLSQMWTIREFLPDMIKMRKGHLVSTCSGLAFSKFSQLTSYTASKYGLRGFLETLKLEMRQHPDKPNIVVSSIFPAFVKTPMIKNVLSYESRYNVKGLVPLEVEEAAEGIVKGILWEDEEIFVPKLVKYFVFFQRIMPTEFADKLESHIFQNLRIVSHVPSNGNLKQNNF